MFEGQAGVRQSGLGERHTLLLARQRGGLVALLLAVRKRGQRLLIGVGRLQVFGVVIEIAQHGLHVHGGGTAANQEDRHGHTYVWGHFLVPPCNMCKG